MCETKFRLKFFFGHKNLGRRFFWAKNFASDIFMDKKKIGLEKILCETKFWSNIYLDQKKLGRKKFRVNNNLVGNYFFIQKNLGWKLFVYQKNYTAPRILRSVII